ncbi:MAG: hypothetical protein IPN13_07125 [Bacteroidetes bacterium]|nr:hypothetical protein [Candidatus Vicinibacter affinis]MBK8873689.1 hypothetical protein [Bacteroidota bacterium]MBK6572515.1 hypothetical protein [Candidatus Vicinibacter affinis]MBK6825325.1 hypothetical protein [Candidatus Vicinibacter affinis]MBK7304300.1 hypothetical protein [Candidatus Vicinibacter affinis]
MKSAVVFYLYLVIITQSFAQYQYPFKNGGDQPYINGGTYFIENELMVDALRQQGPVYKNHSFGPYQIKMETP